MTSNAIYAKRAVEFAVMGGYCQEPPKGLALRPAPARGLNEMAYTALPVVGTAILIQSSLQRIATYNAQLRKCKGLNPMVKLARQVFMGMKKERAYTIACQVMFIVGLLLMLSGVALPHFQPKDFYIAGASLIGLGAIMYGFVQLRYTSAVRKSCEAIVKRLTPLDPPKIASRCVVQLSSHREVYNKLRQRQKRFALGCKSR
jgi:hypothetical protein